MILFLVQRLSTAGIKKNVTPLFQTLESSAHFEECEKRTIYVAFHGQKREKRTLYVRSKIRSIHISIIHTKKTRSLRHRSVLQDLRAILMSPIKKTRTFELFQSLRLSFYQVITLSFSLVSLSNE